MSNNRNETKESRMISAEYKKNGKNIGLRLQKFRDEKHWTLEQFSAQLSRHNIAISASELNNYENFKSNIALDVLYVLCKDFHVDLNELISGRPNKSECSYAWLHPERILNG